MRLSKRNVFVSCPPFCRITYSYNFVMVMNVMRNNDVIDLHTGCTDPNCDECSTKNRLCDKCKTGYEMKELRSTCRRKYYRENLFICSPDRVILGGGALKSYSRLSDCLAISMIEFLHLKPWLTTKFLRLISHPFHI